MFENDRKIDCHPKFANLASKGKTAGSFGGLRMTVKGGSSHPRVGAGGCSAIA
jgi:hypothetical protein